MIRRSHKFKHVVVFGASSGFVSVTKPLERLAVFLKLTLVAKYTDVRVPEVINELVQRLSIELHAIGVLEVVEKRVGKYALRPTVFGLTLLQVFDNCCDDVFSSKELVVTGEAVFDFNTAGLLAKIVTSFERVNDVQLFGGELIVINATGQYSEGVTVFACGKLCTLLMRLITECNIWVFGLSC